jgi:hypothetical protein
VDDGALLVPFVSCAKKWSVVNTQQDISVVKIFFVNNSVTE